MILFNHNEKTTQVQRETVGVGFQAITNISGNFSAMLHFREIYNHIADMSPTENRVSVRCQSTAFFEMFAF